MTTRSSRWETVDHNPVEIAGFLEIAARLVGAAKRKSIDSLRLTPGASVLDIGCGLGRDVETMLQIVGPTGRAIGLDRSEALIAKAIERTQSAEAVPVFRVGSALALPFIDGSFDACRTDRVLQHLADPVRAVAEMIRVTRAGGRVSALEPEWDTFVIGGGDLATARTVARWHATNCCVQPDIGRRLVQLLLDAGCHDLQLDVEVLVVRDLKTADFIFRIHDELQSAINEGAVAQEAGQVWWEALGELDAKGQFFSSCNVVICAGTVS